MQVLLQKQVASLFALASCADACWSVCCWLLGGQVVVPGGRHLLAGLQVFSGCAPAVAECVRIWI